MAASLIAQEPAFSCRCMPFAGPRLIIIAPDNAQSSAFASLLTGAVLFPVGLE
jgi:hypothetical protein